MQNAKCKMQNYCELLKLYADNFKLLIVPKRPLHYLLDKKVRVLKMQFINNLLFI